MNFSFLFSYGSSFRPRSRTKRSAKTQTKIVCCLWLLQTTHMEEMKAGSTGPPVQLTPLSPMSDLSICYFLCHYQHLSCIRPSIPAGISSYKDISILCYSLKQTLILRNPYVNYTIYILVIHYSREQT